MEIMILLLDEPEENFTDFVENLPAHVSLPCLQPSSFLNVSFASQLCSRSVTVNFLNLRLNRPVVTLFHRLQLIHVFTFSIKNIKTSAAK